MSRPADSDDLIRGEGKCPAGAAALHFASLAAAVFPFDRAAVFQLDNISLQCGRGGQQDEATGRVKQAPCGAIRVARRPRARRDGKDVRTAGG